MNTLYQRKLRPRVILPILVVGVLLTIAMLAVLTHDHRQQLHERLHGRAELLANTLNYAAESMDHVGEVRRMIAAMGADADILDILVISAGERVQVIASNKGAWLNETLAALPAGYQHQLQLTLTSREPRFYLDIVHLNYVYAAPVSLGALKHDSNRLDTGAILVKLDASPSYHAQQLHFYIATGIMLGTWGILLGMVYLLLQREILGPVANIANQVDRYQHLQELAPEPVNASVEIEFLDTTIRATLEQQKSHLQAIEQQKEIARASEERFRMITSHSGDMIFRCDACGMLDYISPACETILARKPADLVNTTIFDILHPEDQANFAHQWKLMLDSGQYGVASCRVLRGDGTFAWLETSLQPLSHMESCQLIGVARDVTERKRMETLKSEFISTVSHELRTPLTSISGALGLVVGGVLGEIPAKVHEMLALALKNSQQLKRLIDDLLDMEKLVAGKMSLQMQAHSVQALVEQTIETNRGYGAERNISLVLVSDILDEKIRVDQYRFAQVLSNLLSNAIKYSPDNDTVTVKITRHHGSVRVSVHDNGSGVPDNFKARIFQKFSQADSSDSRKKSGTGLGLAICRELTLHMQGGIDYVSTPGQGACFYVEFPLCA